MDSAEENSLIESVIAVSIEEKVESFSDSDDDDQSGISLVEINNGAERVDDTDQVGEKDQETEEAKEEETEEKYVPRKPRVQIPDGVELTPWNVMNYNFTGRMDKIDRAPILQAIRSKWTSMTIQKAVKDGSGVGSDTFALPQIEVYTKEVYLENEEGEEATSCIGAGMAVCEQVAKEYLYSIFTTSWKTPEDIAERVVSDLYFMIDYGQATNSDNVTYFIKCDVNDLFLESKLNRKAYTPSLTGVSSPLLPIQECSVEEPLPSPPSAE